MSYVFEPDNPDVARILIENHADINAKTNDGWTALHLSVINGMFITIIMNATILTFKIKSHLFRSRFVFNLGKVNTTRFLIENGADINARNKPGQTPSDIANSEGNFFPILKRI